MLKKVVVLNPHPFYQPYALERSVAARFGASFHADGPPDDDLLAATTVLLTHQAPIDRAMLERLPSCRMIVSYSTGLDHMDLEAAAERGILARGIAGYCTEDVAEHALAMILSCARRLHTLDRAMRDHGAWDVTVLAPGRRRLSAQTLGVVGVGRIGHALAVKARALGMRVLGYDPFVVDAPGFPAALVPLDELLAQSDYVSLHAPPHAQEDSREVHGDHTVPIVVARVLDRLRRRNDAGVVEPDIDPAERLDHVSVGGIDVRAVGHVHAMNDHLGTEVSKLAFGIGERVGVPIENRHPRVLPGEGDRAGAPDPGPAATDHDRFAGQLEIHPHSS